MARFLFGPHEHHILSMNLDRRHRSPINLHVNVLTEEIMQVNWVKMNYAYKSCCIPLTV